MSRVAKSSRDNSLSISTSTSNAWKTDKEQSTHTSANDSHSHPSTTTNNERSTNMDRNVTTSTITTDKVQATSPDAWVKEFAKFATLSVHTSPSTSLSNLQQWLYQAYRFNLPCPHGTHFPQHLTINQIACSNSDNTKSKIHNCVNFSSCLAGLQTLRTSP